MRRTIFVIDGTKVRQIRDRQGLTARQLAKRVGISEAYMGRLEKNERQPSPAVRKALTDALCVPLEDIAVDATAGQNAA